MLTTAPVHAAYVAQAVPYQPKYVLSLHTRQPLRQVVPQAAGQFALALYTPVRLSTEETLVRPKLEVEVHTV